MPSVSTILKSWLVGRLQCALLLCVGVCLALMIFIMQTHNYLGCLWNNCA